ncbi:hypothetical protein BKI52_24225 [marine bacterium AO1-C]|nr:hypothetical protein BKI52_24225 [marine bacterium AO1-C]
MMMTFVFIFYMATNMVPANVDQFKIEAQNPSDKTDTIILNFDRDKTGRWKVVPNHKPDDIMFFKFDDQSNFIMQDGQEGKEKTYPLLQKMSVEKNHKKWKKATSVTFKNIEKDKKGLKGLVFDIQKSGKRKRTITMDTDKNKDIGELPTMTVIWE